MGAIRPTGMMADRATPISRGDPRHALEPKPIPISKQVSNRRCAGCPCNATKKSAAPSRLLAAHKLPDHIDSESTSSKHAQSGRLGYGNWDSGKSRRSIKGQDQTHAQYRCNALGQFGLLQMENECSYARAIPLKLLNKVNDNSSKTAGDV